MEGKRSMFRWGKKGNLTEEIITKLTSYYRKAIKDNAPNVMKMKTEILVSVFHSMSNNKKPQHQKCPAEPASWCFYNQTMTLGDDELMNN